MDNLKYFASRKVPFYTTSTVIFKLREAGDVAEDTIKAYELSSDEVEKVLCDQAELIVSWLLEKIFRRAEQLRSQGIEVEYLQEIVFSGNNGAFGIKKVAINQYGADGSKHSIKFSCPVPTKFTGKLWMEECWNGLPPEQAKEDDHYIVLMFPNER